MNWTKSVDENQEMLWEILSCLISFETVSPPGRNSDGVQAYIYNFLSELGAELEQWEMYSGDSLLVGVIPGKRRKEAKSLILNGHVDVAVVGDTSNWTHPPFELTEENGFLYGRGTADMKGAMACALYSVWLLKKYGVKLGGDLQIQSVIGEEAGEAGTRAILERGYKADFGICMDTSNLEIQGQGGVITAWITVKSKDVFHDAVRRNLIHPEGGIFGASAIEKMQDVIQSLRELEEIWYETKSYSGFERGVNTINPAVIEGGRNAAFVADECKLWVTVHFYPNESYESVIKEVEEHLQKLANKDPWFRENPIQFKWGGKSMIEERGEIFPSAEIEKDSEAVRLLCSVHEVCLSKKANVNMNPSVTDVGWLVHGGIPSVLYGPGCPEEAHSVDECVEMQQLLDYSAILLEFMEKWCI